MRYIKSRTLAVWLGFTAETVRLWSVAGQLDRHMIADTLHHSEPSVNTLLENRGMAKPPVFEDFLKEKVRLLTSSEAAEALGIEMTGLYTKLYRKKLEGLRFDSEWRFSSAAIEAFLAQRKGYWTRLDVMHILGCSVKILRKLENLLKPLEISGQGPAHMHFFNPEQVLATVRTLLPNGKRHLAEAWVHEMRTLGRPPLTSFEAMRESGLCGDELESAVKSGQLLYITFPSKLGNRRFSPMSVHQVFLQQEPITPEKFGHIIGTDALTAYRFLCTTMACPLHEHCVTELAHRQSCLVAILTPWLSPGIITRRWLAGRLLPNSRPLLTADTVAAHYGVAAEDVAYAAETGFLGGLRRPDGIWVFSDVRLRLSRSALLHWLAAQKSGGVSV